LKLRITRVEDANMSVYHVLFVITFNASHKYGIGGSFQDVRALSRSLPASRILVLGHFVPQAFSNLRNIDLCEPTKRGIRQYVEREREYLRTVQVVHAYDRTAYILGGWLAIKLRVPLVGTKPGGGKGTFLYPYPKNVVVVQKSDYLRLRGRKLIAPRRVVHIANRVVRQTKSHSSRSNPFSGYDDGWLKVLCIGRMCREYVKLFEQSMALVARLNREGIKSCLAIVGEPSDYDVVKYIESHDMEFVNAHKSEEYIVDAFEHMDHSDVCIGAGRVLMEALSAGKLAFFPVNGTAIPCFLYEKTYAQAFENNFSSRTCLTEIDVETHFSAFLALAGGAVCRDQHEQFVAQRFTEDLDAETGVQRLLRFYCSLEREKHRDKFGYFVQHVFAHIVNHYIFRPIKRHSV
jgi:hypothetical protein